MSFISFKPLEESDFPQLFAWLHTDHIKKWWYPDALLWEKFEIKYRKKLNSDSQWGFVIYFGKLPIGYIQYYDASKLPDDFGVCDLEGTYGMDLYIGDPEFIGKGYGTQTLREFIEFIKQKHDIKKLIIDPHAENSVAIRTYEKIGFKKVHEEDQPNYGRIVFMAMEL